MWSMGRIKSVASADHMLCEALGQLGFTCLAVGLTWCDQKERRFGSKLLFHETYKS